MASKTASKSSKKAPKLNGEANKKRKKPCQKYCRDDILCLAQEIWDARVRESAKPKRVTASSVLEYLSNRGKGPRNSAKTPSLRNVGRFLKDFHPCVPPGSKQ